jgi:ribosomal protein L44E
MEPHYSFSDIKWIKNVKRDGGRQWAYTEYGVGDSFLLNWSKHYGANASGPQPGEIVVIFQTIQDGLGLPKGTYLTHLVTPLDTDFKDSLGSHPLTRLVGVVGKATPPISTGLNEFNLSKVSRGMCYRIHLVGRRLGTSGFSTDEKQRRIWELFKNKKTDLRQLFGFISETEDEDEGSLEGTEKKKLRIHKYYERDPRITKMAKAKAIRENRLKCEVCSFHFEKSYPVLGKGFIECHHIIPIGNGMKRITKIKDLALLCANCHRMIHRKHEDKYLSVANLKELFVKSDYSI